MVHDAVSTSCITAFRTPKRTASLNPAPMLSGQPSNRPIRRSGKSDAQERVLSLSNLSDKDLVTSTLSLHPTLCSHKRSFALCSALALSHQLHRPVHRSAVAGLTLFFLPPYSTRIPHSPGWKSRHGGFVVRRLDGGDAPSVCQPGHIWHIWQYKLDGLDMPAGV